MLVLICRFVDEHYIPSNALDLKELRHQLCSSVRRHLLAEVPFGLLLSGGLDSSLVTFGILLKFLVSKFWSECSIETE